MLTIGPVVAAATTVGACGRIAIIMHSSIIVLLLEPLVVLLFVALVSVVCSAWSCVVICWFVVVVVPPVTVTSLSRSRSCMCGDPFEMGCGGLVQRLCRG